MQAHHAQCEGAGSGLVAKLCSGDVYVRRTWTAPVATTEKWASGLTPAGPRPLSTSAGRGGGVGCPQWERVGGFFQRGSTRKWTVQTSSTAKRSMSDCGGVGRAGRGA